MGAYRALVEAAGGVCVSRFVLCCVCGCFCKVNKASSSPSLLRLFKIMDGYSVSSYVFSSLLTVLFKYSISYMSVFKSCVFLGILLFYLICQSYWHKAFNQILISPF